MAEPLLLTYLRHDIQSCRWRVHFISRGTVGFAWNSAAVGPRIVGMVGAVWRQNTRSLAH